MGPVGLCEVDEKIFKYADTDDLLQWCWNSAAVRRMCSSPVVWSNRLVKVDNIYTIQMVKRYISHIDSLDLSSCDDIVIQSIDGFNLHRVSFKGNSWISDDAFAGFVSRNCRNCRIVDISNCLNLTNKALFAIANNCPNLEYLNCSGGLLTLSGLLALKNTKSITTLCISNCLLLSTDNLLSAIGLFPRLRRLDLSTNASVNYNMLCILLPMITELRYLDVRGCEDLNGYQLDSLKRMFPNVTFKENAKIYDDSIESIRAYLLSMLRSN